MKTHSDFLQVMAAGTLRTNREICHDLLETEIHGEEGIETATRLVCELLTKQSYLFSANLMGRSNWREDFLKKPVSSGMMSRTVAMPDEIEKFVMTLYEENEGATRETILYLDTQEGDHRISYLSVFLRNAVRHLGLEAKTPIIYEQVRILFSPEKPLIQWCEKLKSEGLSLKQFAGQTNTVLGMYKKLVEENPALKKELQGAEHNIDLGGGFATPEVSEIFGYPFVSYDLTPPEKALEWEISFAAITGAVSESELARYREKLRKQPFQEFDVFTDSFPDHYETYNITSFGFLNSTITSLSTLQPEVPLDLKKFNTTFFAVKRIAELAAQGKSICFLTYGRPMLMYMNRLVLIKFADRRVTKIEVPRHKAAFRPFDVSPKEIAPELPRETFAAFSNQRTSC